MQGHKITSTIEQSLWEDTSIETIKHILVLLQKSQDSSHFWDGIYELYNQNHQLNLYRLLQIVQELGPFSLILKDCEHDHDLEEFELKLRTQNKEKVDDTLNLKLNVFIGHLNSGEGDNQQRELLRGLYLADNPEIYNKADHVRAFIRCLIRKDQDTVLDAFLHRYPHAFNDQMDYDDGSSEDHPHKISHIEYAINHGKAKALKVLLNYSKTQKNDNTFLWAYQNTTLLHTINQPSHLQRDECIFALCVRYLENVLEYAEKDNIGADVPLKQYLAERNATGKGLFVTGIDTGLPYALKILRERNETDLVFMLHQAIALLDHPLGKFKEELGKFAQQKMISQTELQQELFVSFKTMFSERNLKNIWSKQVSGAAQFFSCDNAKVEVTNKQNGKEFIRVPRGVSHICAHLSLKTPGIMRQAAVIAKQRLDQPKELTFGRKDPTVALYTALVKLGELLDKPLTEQKVHEWAASVQAILQANSPCLSQLTTGMDVTRGIPSSRSSSSTAPLARGIR